VGKRFSAGPRNRERFLGLTEKLRNVSRSRVQTEKGFFSVKGFSVSFSFSLFESNTKINNTIIQKYSVDEMRDLFGRIYLKVGENIIQN